MNKSSLPKSCSCWDVDRRRLHCTGYYRDVFRCDSLSVIEILLASPALFGDLVGAWTYVNRRGEGPLYLIGSRCAEGGGLRNRINIWI